MPAYTPTTVDDCIALINSYVVDNNTNNITPAKFRGIMLTLLDFMQTAIAGGTTPATPGLDAVVTAGDLSHNPLFVGGDISNGGVLAFTKVGLSIAGVAKAMLALTGGNGALELSTGVHTATLQADAGMSVDAAYRLPINPAGGRLALEGGYTLQSITDAGATTNHPLVVGNTTDYVSYSTVGSSGYASSIQKFFLGIVSGVAQLFLRGSGAQGTTIVSGNPSVANTLTLPTVTDIIATKGDCGQRYRLTGTSTGAGSYTFSIPALPFTPVLVVISPGGVTTCTSILYADATTTTVNVAFSGAAPVSGASMVFNVIIFG